MNSFDSIKKKTHTNNKIYDDTLHMEKENICQMR